MKPFQPSAVAAMIALSRIAASSCLLALLSIAITPTRAGAAQDLILADGFDVDLTTAYFVSPDGVDTNPGTAALPFQTIGKGIAAGFADGLKKNVLVAGGTYGESVALANGVSVFGGYQAGSWVRDTSEYSIIDGIASAGIHKRTVLAANITAATTFDGFVVFGAVNGNGGGNSYGIYVTGSNANLSITNNLIFAGHGGSGADGSAGPAGTAGVDGGGRNPDLATPDPAYDALTATGAGECNVANNRQIANGGALSCGADNVGGGAGGGNQCPVKSGCTAGTASGCSAFTWSEFTAIDGGAGNSGTNGGTGGAGNFGGDDMVLYNASAIPSLLCYLPTDTDGDGNNTFGLDGNSGGNGGNGGGVSGCSVAIGAVAGGHWVGGAGLSGNAGGNGGGGGGGGAGGGARCNAAAPSSCPGGHDNLGGHGGGGGSGGCGGSGGSAGSSGGGAFGIFIVGAGPAPVVTGNTFYGGSGGAGGNGGNGGGGGVGGAGGLGGSAALFCSDVGGRGGNGGAGGYGAGGGGGCGGASFGIYTSGIGTPNYCQPIANNTINDGSAGAGGAGGLSAVNSGGSGQNGIVADCSFH
jgi:hypothetical protein